MENQASENRYYFCDSKKSAKWKSNNEEDKENDPNFQNIHKVNEKMSFESKIADLTVEEYRIVGNYLDHHQK